MLLLTFVPGTLAAQLVADFAILNSSGCSPLQVQFTNQSSGPIASYTWYFGTGNKSSQANPSAIYINPGSYMVSLVVKDAQGNSDSIAIPNAVEVFAAPTVNFSATPRSGCSPLYVQFQGQSTPGSAGISSRVWDFGDGTVDSGLTPANLYSQTGTMSVSLIVTDSNGCASTLTKPDLITVNPPPVADFTSNDTIACNAPLNTTFINQSISGVGGALSYQWAFGNGDSSTAANPTYTYTSSGNYTVSLQVTDTAGCVDDTTISHFISIGAENAGFTVNDPSGCQPFTTSFANTTQPGDSGTQYLWYFGDGDTSNALHPIHTYQDSGTYDVRLVVTSRANCSDSFILQDAVTVMPAPDPQITLSDTGACQPPLQVQFQANAPGATSWLWHFGDGDTATAENPQHSYTAFGTFPVYLEVWGANGCRAVSDTHRVQVLPPVAGFTVDSPSGCIPHTVRFSDTSFVADSISTYLWLFGDGITSTTANPAHTYTTEGTYQPQLIITSATGCTDTFTYKSIRVGIPIKPAFVASDTVGCLWELTVQWSNLTPNASLVDSFYWEFGDGGTSWEFEPRYKYDIDSGFYDVTLTAWNNGCADSTVKEKYIHIYPPYARISASNVKCSRDSFTLTSNSVGADSVVWIFPDSSRVSSATVSKKFPDTGTYEVTLVAFNFQFGCTDTATKEITVNPPIFFDFTTDTASCLPHLVMMTDTAGPEVDSIMWDYGDTSAPTTDTSHTYTTAGLYTITATIWAGRSCTYTYTKEDYVRVYGAEPNLSLNPDSGCIPLTVTLSDSSTAFSGIVGKRVIPGTGDTIPFQDSVSFTYTQPPMDQQAGYQIEVLLTTNYGCTTSVVVPAIAARPRPDYTTTLVPGCSTVSFLLDPERKPVNGLDPLQFTWRFPDTTIQSMEEELITFTSDGSYPFTMIAVDTLGCSDSLQDNLEAEIKTVQANFTASPLSKSCPPMLVNFTDLSQPGYVPITNWKWYFGDGTTSNRQHPQKIYLRAGSFDVALVVTDSIGCRDSIMMPDLLTIGGASATISFDTLQGCAPLTIRYQALSQNARKISLDLGDGTVLNSDSAAHTFQNPGQYIPVLIISDSFGCTYSYPLPDTFKVYENPEAEFTNGLACFGKGTSFTDLSRPGTDSLVNWRWSFGDSTFSSRQNPMHVFDSSGLYTVQLVVENEKGCFDTASGPVDVGGIRALFGTDSGAVACLGVLFQFDDLSVSDTLISSWAWTFGDGDSASIQDPQHVYTSSGFYDVELMVEDVSGCRDTASINEFVYVADTAAPAPPEVWAVSVVDNQTIELRYYQHKDSAAFRTYVIWQKAGGAWIVVDSIFQLNDTLWTGTGYNTLDNSYCFRVQVVEECATSEIDSSRVHCTMNLTATPGVRQAELAWTPYIGWENVERYEVYREVSTNPSNNKWVQVGQVPGGDTTFIDPTIQCYTQHAYHIRAVEQDGNGAWSWSDTSRALPVWEANVPVTELIRATVEDDEDVLVEWESLEAQDIREYLLQRSIDGFIWSDLGTFVPGVDEYLDEQVAVDEESYRYRIGLIDSCGDMGDWSNIGKSILLQVDTTSEGQVLVYWSAYREWAEGVQFYELQLQNMEGGWDPIYTSNSDDDTSYLDLLASNREYSQYCYRVVAHRDGPAANPNANVGITSTSNIACANVRSALWVPTAFSPNDDSHNQIFAISGMFVRDFELRIYNRWGQLIFKTEEVENHWRGTYNGKPVPEGAYVYVITAKGADQRIYNLSGTVTVIR